MYNSTRSFQWFLAAMSVLPVLFFSHAIGASMPGDGSFNIPSSGSASLPCGSSLTIYDDGGPLGAYNAENSGWLVLENSGAAIIHLEGTFSFECGYDVVTIWSGNAPGSTNAIISYSCDGIMSFDSEPGQTISLNTHGDGSLSWAGFEWNLSYIGECGIVNLPQGSGYSLSCGNAFDLFDDGGPDGNYAPNNTSYLELDNSGSGIINISGTYNIGEGDSLVIYHGNLLAAEHLVSYTGGGELIYNSQPGMDIILYFYTDDAGESAGLDLQVTYSGSCDCSGEDSTPPFVINIPEQIVIDADFNCGSVVYWPEPYFYDNCSAVTFNSSVSSGSYFTYPGATVVYSVSDLSGNTIEHSFDVVIEDNTNPVVNFYETTITSVNSPGECGAYIFWTEAAVSDNCSAIDNIWSTHAPGDFFNIGWDTVTTYASDMAGNIGSSELYVYVMDNEMPEIICPANMTVCEGIPINYPLPEVQDNCSVQFFQTSGLPTGSIFYAGTTTNSFSAHDAAGNVQTCMFNITANPQPIVTLTAPQDTLCLDDISMTLTGEPNGGTYTGPGLSGATIIANDAGLGTFEYSYEFVNEFGCANSISLPVVVDACIGIDDVEFINFNSLYPNPASEVVFIKLSEKSDVAIYDMSGRLIQSFMLTQGIHQLDMSRVADGDYLVRITNLHSGTITSEKLMLFH